MSTNQVIKSKGVTLSITLLLSIGFLLSVIGIYFLIDVLQGEHWKFISVVFLLSLVMLGFFSIGAIFFGELLELDDEKLVVLTILGKAKKVIYLKDIILCEERVRENNDGKTEQIVIYSSLGKYVPFFFYTSNYEEIKTELKKRLLSIHLEKNIWRLGDYNMKNYNLIGGVILVMTGLGIAYLFTSIIERDIIKENQITVITGTLKQDLKVQSPDDSPYMIIKLKEYPYFDFDLKYQEIAAVTQIGKLIRDIGEQDTIQLGIKKSDYQIKIDKSESISFWDKHNSYESIKVCTIASKNTEYLKLEKLNQEYNSEKKFGWVFSIFGVTLVIGGIYCFYLYNKQYYLDEMLENRLYQTSN